MMRMMMRRRMINHYYGDDVARAVQAGDCDAENEREKEITGGNAHR